jgi:hypothetical protein
MSLREVMTVELCEHGEGVEHPGCPGGRVLSDAEALVALGVPEDRLSPDHIVTIRDDSWHMAHPIFCKLDECEFDAAARGWEQQPAETLGKYRWSAVAEPFRRMEDA